MIEVRSFFHRIYKPAFRTGSEQMSVVIVAWQMSVVTVAYVSNVTVADVSDVRRCQWSLWPGIGNWEANSLTLGRIQ